MTRIGLISDTHMPARWPSLPQTVFEVFAEVDLILHAGDVGELWVLDQLSAIAPVIAVHGNDETAEAEAALPYLQTVVAAGQHIVLTHTHYPDRDEELASRSNNWQPSFERRVNFARQHGAEVIVYGHFHIPMCLQQEGIWLVNPGAIASGNYWTRQLVQTVAILELGPGESPHIQHYDLSTGAIHDPIFDAAGFGPTAAHYSAPILEPKLYAVREWLWNELRPVDPARVMEVLLRLAHRRWAWEDTLISVQELVAALQTVDTDGKLRAKLGESRLFLPYT